MKVYRIIFILFAICYLPFAICFAQEITKGEELFFTAQKAFQKGYYQVSKVFLEKFLQKNSLESPFYLEAQVLLADCYFKENEFQRAKDLYSKIIEDFPKSEYFFFATYSLGCCLFELRDFKEAYNTFQRFLEKFPQNKLTPLDSKHLTGLREDAHLKIIECLYNLKSYQSLIEEVDLYLKKYSKKEKIDYLFLYRAEALFYLERYLEAMDDYQRVLNCSDSKLINLARLGMGFSYLRLNQNLKAYGEFKKLTPLDSKHLTGLMESAAEQEIIDQATIGCAEALYNMDEYSKAKEIYNRLKGITQNSDRVHYGLGLCLLKEKNYSEAKEEFSKVGLNSSIYPEAMYLAGLCLYNLGKFQEAFSIFEDILRELKPDKNLIPKIEFYISDCLFRIGKETEALKRFKNLRIKYPDSEIAPQVLYRLGDYYYKKNIFRSAKRYFNAVISDFSEARLTGPSLYYLGKISQEEGNYLEAKDLFLKAKEKNRDLECLILPEIALIYRNLGDYEEAISSLKRAIEISPSNENSYLWQFQIAELLQEQKRFDEAIYEYLKIPQDSELATKAILRIAKIYEDKEDWGQAENFYRKISNLDIQEAKFAKERLEQIKVNFKGVR